MAKFVTFEKTDNFVDYSTGEVTSKVETKVLKLEKNTEKFFKLFVENVGTLYGLNALSSFKVLFAILNMATTRENVICLAFGMRSRICQTIGIHLNVFARGIKELVDKEILKKTDSKDYFTLNPYIFGQGTFIDIEKLRQSIEFEYDFKKGEIKRTISADSVTSTGVNILKNPSNYDVIDIAKDETDKDLTLGVLVKHNGGVEINGATAYPTEQLLPFNDEELQNNVQNEDNNIKHDDKIKYDIMIKSLEITSKMLDRIKELQIDGKKEEAMSLQKDMQNYLNSFSKI